MRLQAKFILPFLSTVGLIVLFSLGRPIWMALPQPRTASAGTNQQPLKLRVPKDQLVIGSIDTHDERLQVHGRSGSLLEVMGWITSTKPDDPIKRVELLLNGRTVATVHAFFPRPDVSAAFDRPDFNMTGWREMISLDGVKPETYELGVKGTTTSGKEGNLKPLQLFVSE